MQGAGQQQPSSSSSGLVVGKPVGRSKTSHDDKELEVGAQANTGLSRLLEKQMEEIECLSKKIEVFTKYQDDYRGLKKLIDQIQDKVKHPHRVPVAGTNLAFVDGHIVHTNEFHVLLGDNYFALRSGRQASQIVDRRLKDIDQKLGHCEGARKKTEDWFKITEEHKRDKEEFVEIIETM